MQYRNYQQSRKNDCGCGGRPRASQYRDSERDPFYLNERESASAPYRGDAFDYDPALTGIVSIDPIRSAATGIVIPAMRTISILTPIAAVAVTMPSSSPMCWSTSMTITISVRRAPQGLRVPQAPQAPQGPLVLQALPERPVLRRTGPQADPPELLERQGLPVPQGLLGLPAPMGPRAPQALPGLPVPMVPQGPQGPRAPQALRRYRSRNTASGHPGSIGRRSRWRNACGWSPRGI